MGSYPSWECVSLSVWAGTKTFSFLMISNVYVNERHRNPNTLDCILCKQWEGAAFVTECNLLSCSRYSKSSGWEDIHFPFIWRQIKEKNHNISRTSTRMEKELKTTRKMIFSVSFTSFSISEIFKTMSTAFLPFSIMKKITTNNNRRERAEHTMHIGWEEWNEKSQNYRIYAKLWSEFSTTSKRF